MYLWEVFLEDEKSGKRIRLGEVYGDTMSLALTQAALYYEYDIGDLVAVQKQLQIDQKYSPYILEIYIPILRPRSPILRALQDRFPYREGESFGWMRSNEEKSLDIVYIHLNQPLSSNQIVYLEQGKAAGMVRYYQCKKQREHE